MSSQTTALRSELRRKDEFIATLGHELRNPLSVLTTASLIFEMDGATTADMKHAAEIIGRQVQHVTRLINDLLDMEPIANGKLQLDVRPVDLREIVTNTLESRRADAERRKQSLTLQLTPDPVVVDVDAVRLAQVVSNLVDNAVKYTPDAGHINVAVNADGREAVIVVQDNDGLFVSGVALADEGIVTTRVRGEYSAPRGDFRVVGAPPSLFPPLFGGRHRALTS